MFKGDAQKFKLTKHAKFGFLGYNRSVLEKFPIKVDCYLPI